MVSKTLLACLAALACFSVTSATVGQINFGNYVGGLAYVNRKFSLGFLLDEILGGVLNLVANVLSGVLNFLDNLFGGHTGGNIPFIAAPSNIQSLAGVLVKVGPIFGKLVSPSLGIDLNILGDIHAALTLSLFNNLQLDTGSASYLDNAISLKLAQQKVAKISAILNKNKFKSSEWALVANLFNDYLSVVNNSNIDVDLYVAATLKYIKLQVALLRMAGYPSVDEYTTTVVETCNDVFQQIGYSRPVTVLQVVVNDVPTDCNCF